MTKKKVFRIAGEAVQLGETRDLKLKISEQFTGDPVGVPIRVMRGRKRGPTLFVTATVHGDELNGMGVIHEIMYGAQLELIAGTLILVPVVNVFGIETQNRYMPDRRDLNRFFPGFKNGSLTSRVAFLLFEEIAKKSDFGIELHSAAQPRTNFPNIRGDLKNADVRRLAWAFGCELIIDGKGPDGSFRREATKAGCPTIILEAGEPLKIEQEAVEVGVRGVNNVLRELGMVAGDPVLPPYQVRISRSTWVRAEVGGILRFHVKPGDPVEQGQRIATNASVFGERQNILEAPCDGIVLGMTTLPMVKPGEPVCHIAVPSRSLKSLRLAAARVTGAGKKKRIRAGALVQNLARSETETMPGRGTFAKEQRKES
ncbi:MAG TPA: M14 family metallopeptidase [Phycisphaerae bacterium]|nr:M14 family metallopeptidase [Phycisphaerae bacterium]HRW51357.1 M14 family metallopeptidase [Phycisphaerae bacterium]